MHREAHNVLVNQHPQFTDTLGQEITVQGERAGKQQKASFGSSPRKMNVYRVQATDPVSVRSSARGSGRDKQGDQDVKQPEMNQEEVFKQMHDMQSRILGIADAPSAIQSLPPEL